MNKNKRRRYKYHKKRKYKRRKRRQTNNIKLLLMVLIISISIFGIYKSLKKSLPYDQIAYLYINHNTIVHIENYCYKIDKDMYAYLAAYFTNMNYNAKEYSSTHINNFLESLSWYDRCKISKKYKTTAKIMEKAIKDIECFPVKADNNEYSFEDTYGALRTYGGNRTHLGTDIMDVKNIRGRLEIVSMTDGVVANIGWNDKGGWRIGINSPSGTYFYYAHLESYVKGIHKGMKIRAGDTLGYMGDSGYGETGTVGMFPVHLHLGIMLRDIIEDEYWINPYYIIKYAQEK